MTVKTIKTGEEITVNDCYGLRLIEQGKAVLAAPREADGKKAQDEAGEEKKPKRDKKE